MKRVWEMEDLIDCFTIVSHEMKTVETKTGANRLGYAVLLKYFQSKGRFPNNLGDIPKPVVEYIAKQVRINSKAFSEYDWTGRTIKYHRAEIRDFFGTGPKLEFSQLVHLLW